MKEAGCSGYFHVIHRHVWWLDFLFSGNYVLISALMMGSNMRTCGAAVRQHSPMVGHCWPFCSRRQPADDARKDIPDHHECFATNVRAIILQTHLCSRRLGQI